MQDFTCLATQVDIASELATFALHEIRFENPNTILESSMNIRLASIALITFLSLAQTVTAQITTPERFVQIRSIDLSRSVLELFNSGTTSQSLNGWRFCTHDEDQVRRYSGSTGLNGVTLASQQSLFIHFNNDADPTNAQERNINSISGNFATPLDANGAYGAQIYVNSAFSSGAAIADHIQFSVDGVDNTSADDRSDEAEGEVWSDQNEWIAISATTEMIVLNDVALDQEIHSASDYAVIEPTQTLLGDINGDQVVDFLDISPFITVLSVGGFQEEADINGDDSVDFLDIAPFIILLST